MEKHKKNILLQNCNTLEADQLISIVQSNAISLEEFIESGLENTKVKAILASLTTNQEAQNSKNEKNEFVEKVLKGKISADEIKSNINNKKYSFDDLLDAGLPQKSVNSLKYYCNSNRMTSFKNISQLPAMEEGRTDLYFVGLPGTGKSTLLSGIFKMAEKKGILIPDTHNNVGNIFMSQLIQDINNGVLPMATSEGSYNYVSLSLSDENNKTHPFNIVDVPGELFKYLHLNGNVDELLKYINNTNKKILIFVVDSLLHESGYEGTMEQSSVYVNILQMFKSNGILESTDAIYLVANKFDAIKKSKYADDNRQHKELAYDFLQEEFLNLIQNCKMARDDSKNQFKIRILPFSIGNISHKFILNEFNNDYANYVLNQIIEDSFVVKGGRLTKLFR